MGQRPPGPRATSFPSGVIARCGVTRRGARSIPGTLENEHWPHVGRIAVVTGSVCAVQNKAAGHAFAMCPWRSRREMSAPRYNADFIEIARRAQVEFRR